nr:MAG TPA: hypothetical protein [Caudoviricetes sp.]
MFRLHFFLLQILYDLSNRSRSYFPYRSSRR